MIPKSALSSEQLCARPTNRAICDYLDEFKPSAHSDLGSYLFKSADYLDCAYYSPNIQQYRYVVLHTLSGIVFAGAFGMRDLVLRLPLEQLPTALEHGGKKFHELLDWVAFDPFDLNVKKAVMTERIARWCRVAYVAARVKES